MSPTPNVTSGSKPFVNEGYSHLFCILLVSLSYPTPNTPPNLVEKVPFPLNSNGILGLISITTPGIDVGISILPSLKS